MLGQKKRLIDKIQKRASIQNDLLVHVPTGTIILQWIETLDNTPNNYILKYPIAFKWRRFISLISINTWGIDGNADPWITNETNMGCNYGVNGDTTYNSAVRLSLFFLGI